MSHPMRVSARWSAALALAFALAGCTASGYGVVTPGASPTPTAVPSSSPTASPVASQAPSPSPTASPTAAPAPSPSPSAASGAIPPITAQTFTNPTNITNRFAPFAVLVEATLEGEEDGEPVKVVMKKLAETKAFTINGQAVQALVLEVRETVDGELEEVTKDYYAQADDGTVYYLGEDVDNYEDGELDNHDGSWLFGRDTQVAGVHMPADPKVGMKFRLEDVPGTNGGYKAREDAEITSLTDEVTVPFGKYTGVLTMKVAEEGEPEETKQFAQGVGVIVEAAPGEKVELTARSQN